MEKKTEEVSEYYDGFSSYQLAKGINSRHLSIFRFLRKAGLKKNSIVLEIGCGIGTVTHLISSAERALNWLCKRIRERDGLSLWFQI